MDFNQESIHNGDSWAGYRGLRSIGPNKAASIRASPQVAAGSIIGRHEPPLDNEPADAPLRGLRSSLLQKDSLFTSEKMSASFHPLVPDAPLPDPRCRALLANFT